MLRKILRKFQPNFQHYVKKTEAQAKKKWFSYKNKKTCISPEQIDETTSFLHVDTSSQKIKVDQKFCGLAWSKMVVANLLSGL